MLRRDFLKSVATVAITAAGARYLINDLNAAELPLVRYKKALLTAADGKPLRLKDIQNDVPYIFFYPFAATPCLLLNLDLPVKELEMKTMAGDLYKAPGGTGPKRTIVAYSAICQHQLVYPTKEYSVINFYGKNDEKCMHGVQLIKCCAHNSIYDPKECGRVVDGPAERPLVMIALEYDAAKDELYAVGVAGKEPYTEFFSLYKSDLRKEYGSSAKAKAEVESCKVIKLADYSGNLIRC
ncbi:MAG: Rieske 2Fe-2S domain-containing protein [Campylobacterales bacterium]